MTAVTIRSGGQAGVDRAALEFAVGRGLPYCGWCPRGGWAEDLPEPPGLLALYPRLTETPARDPAQRTAWNVRDGHATLILVPGPDPAAFPGTRFTRQCAELIFLRPCLVVDLTDPPAAEMAREWLARVCDGLGLGEIVLNVAGPRESEAPGVYEEAGELLGKFLAHPSGQRWSSKRRWDADFVRGPPDADEKDQTQRD
jgi:hypothetical protein